AERQVEIGDATEELHRQFIELRPFARVVVLPSIADGGAVEPVRLDRRFHVPPARRAGHRRCFPGVGAIADFEPSTTRHELYVGAPEPEGLRDHPLPLHVCGPVTRRQDRHPTPGRCDRTRASLRGQPTSSPLLWRLVELPQQKVGTLAGILAEAIGAGNGAHRWPRGRVSNGLPRSARATPAQNPAPYDQWQISSTAKARCGATPGSRARRTAAAAQANPCATGRATRRGPCRRSAAPSDEAASAAGANGRQVGNVACLARVDAFATP